MPSKEATFDGDSTMLTYLNLKNFKIWKSTGPIFLAPVTLLLGTNSSGKSSLIQSLLLIRQTVKSDDPDVNLNLGAIQTLATQSRWDSSRMCFANTIRIPGWRSNFNGRPLANRRRLQSFRHGTSGGQRDQPNWIISGSEVRR